MTRTDFRKARDTGFGYDPVHSSIFLFGFTFLGLHCNVFLPCHPQTTQDHRGYWHCLGNCRQREHPMKPSGKASELNFSPHWPQIPTPDFLSVVRVLVTANFPKLTSIHFWIDTIKIMVRKCRGTLGGGEDVSRCWGGENNHWAWTLASKAL